MAENKNALAELTERLEEIMPYVTVGCEVCAIDKHLTSKRAKDFIVASQRIIAELAKVDATYIEDPVHNNICHLAYDALKDCRAIAEEGGRDDK